MKGLGESLFYEAWDEAWEKCEEKTTALINRLNQYLLENNLLDELSKSVSDKDYQKELIEKYNIIAQIDSFEYRKY